MEKTCRARGEPRAYAHESRGPGPQSKPLTNERIKFTLDSFARAVNQVRDPQDHGVYAVLEGAEAVAVNAETAASGFS